MARPDLRHIPEPPIVVSGPLNSNNSSNSNKKVKELLRELRLKYGIVTGTPTSIDTDDSLVENIHLIEPKSFRTKTPVEPLIIRNNQDLDRCSSSGSVTECLHTKQLIERIKKQDEQLEMINEKIDRILKLQQERQNDCIANSSAESYLDSSIERVRNDLICMCQQNNRSTMTNTDDQFYSTMLSEVNSAIFVPNESSSPESSISNSSPMDVRSTNLHPHHNKKKKKEINNRPIGTTKVVHRREESIYIERLANKYNQINNGYGLSEHNCSIATKNYLDKYGLKWPT